MPYKYLSIKQPAITRIETPCALCIKQYQKNPFSKYCHLSYLPEIKVRELERNNDGRAESLLQKRNGILLSSSQSAEKRQEQNLQFTQTIYRVHSQKQATQTL
jgi:hypothetical protein